MQYVLFYLGLVLILASLGGLYIKLKEIVNWKIEEVLDYKKKLTVLGLLSVGLGLSTMITCIGAPIMNGWIDTYSSGDWGCTIIGSFLLGTLTGILYSTFRIHFYKENKPQKLDKALYIVTLALPFLIVAAVWILSEGYAWHLDYPLVNGINFNEGFVSPGHGTPSIAWYALCILGGALICYAVCDHFMYEEFGKHGILESTFLIAFPAGIIGARIGYVIGNWNLEFANREWWHIFAMWEGGLTILSGAVIGIIVGILWFHWRHPNLNIGKSLNIIIPCILIAQGIGRWGNFFNCEVHGFAVPRETFGFLPSVILNNLQFSSASASGTLPAGQIYVPLFLIESVVNFIGYFVLFFGCTKGLKKFVVGGDIAFGYVGWYGMTRVLMEPLRDASYNMGDEGAWSWIWSIIYVAFAIVAIVLNHLIRYLAHKRKGTVATIENTDSYIKNYAFVLASVVLISSVLFITGLTLYLTNPAPLPDASQIELIPYNVGLILWIIGLSLYSALIIPIYNIYEAKYQKTHLEVANG